MIKTGIINNHQILELENDELLPYLNQFLKENPENYPIYELYQQKQLTISDSTMIEYFVKFLGYIIIKDKTIYFQENLQNETIDKIAYVKEGYKLKKLPKMICENGKIKKYLNPIQQEIERIGFEHTISPENELSFWYPKTNNIGFQTPNTVITEFTAEEIAFIKNGKWDFLSEKEILQRIKKIARHGNLNLNNEMFIRLGNTSNKFNFNSCHIQNIYELYPKLMIMLDNLVFKLEWQQKIELVLREYIKTSYHRNKIYNGMPLNTEFRVFYDFDTKKLLGIFNYWDKDTMLDHLKGQDLTTFADTAQEIENDFYHLSPYLKEEITDKLPNATLKGKWSIDFLYDGNSFILIDMAHAECSYYYEKVLSKQL